MTMTLKEAIEIGEDIEKQAHWYPGAREFKALKILIGAGKLLENPTDPRLIYARKLLLGEIGGSG